MLLLRDMLIGYVTWVMTLSSIGGVWFLSFYCFGPPAADRERSAAFILGGAGLLFITLILGMMAAAIYSNWRS